MFVTRYLIALARPVSARIALAAVIQLTVVATNVVQAAVLAGVVAALLDGAGSRDVVALLGVVALCWMARSVLVGVGEALAWRTDRVVADRLHARVFGTLFALGPGYVSTQRSGELRTLVTDQVEALGPYCSRYLPSLVTAVLGPVVVIAVLWTHSWVAALVAVVAVAFWFFVPTVVRSRSKQREGVVWGELGTLGADYVDTFQGLLTLKALGTAERRRSALREQSERVRRVLMAQFRVLFVGGSLTRVAAVGGPVLLVTLTAVGAGGAELGAVGLLTVLLLAAELFRPVSSFGAEAFTAFHAVGAAKAIDAFLRTPVNDVATTAAPPSSGVAPDGSVVEFSGVTYGYPERGQPAVDDVSFRLAPGRRVAIVGRSGSGKTTLVSLLLGFFDCDAGRITIDGADVRTMPRACLHSKLSLVSQDTYLFHGTIAENIGLGRADASRADIERVAEQVGLADFVASLPQRYDTEIGERGTLLSGGQRQRIALARALLKEAPILVLDEATSNVDAATEASIQQALDRVTANKATLVIAHDYRTIRHADEVVVLDAGKVVERGKPDELYAAGGAFARFAAHQEPQPPNEGARR